VELAHRRDGLRVSHTHPALQAPGLVLQVLKTRVGRKITYRRNGLLSAARRPLASASAECSPAGHRSTLAAA
jgi:hypothetical protein